MKERIKIILTAIVTTLIAIVLSATYIKFITVKNYVLMIITCIFAILLSAGSYYIIEIVKDKIGDYSYKKLVKFLLIIIGAIAVFCIVALNWKCEWRLFTDKKSDDSVRKQLFNIEPNKDYTFQFDVEAKAGKRDDTYVIIIKELDKSEKEITTTRIRFNEFDGTKEIKVKTT